MANATLAHLSFVEGSAYRREAGRLIGRQIASGIDVRELLGDARAYSNDLLAALFAQIEREFYLPALSDARRYATDLGLGDLTAAEAQQLADSAMATVIEEASAMLDSRLEEIARAILRMQSAGASLSTIDASLAGEAGAVAMLAPVTSVLSATGGGLVSALERAVLDGATQALADEVGPDSDAVLFAWETVEDERVCEDVFENSCAPRHGEELTSGEWDAFGGPGGDNLICSMFAKGAFSQCRCVLREAGTDISATPVQVGDAAKAGADRALKEAA